MVEAWAEKRVVISPDPSTLDEAVAARFLSRVAKRADEGKLAHIALTGGSMGAAVLAAAARSPRIEKIDWSGVHFWWSDERWVPKGHDDRNEKQSRAALLDALDIPAGNLHVAPASDDGLDLDAAADVHAEELARFAGSEGPWPSFDVCFLGVGPDGHIASLFPDRPEILVTDRGRPVARIVPVSGESKLDRLIAAGLVEPAPRRRVKHPEPPIKGAGPLSDIVLDMGLIAEPCSHGLTPSASIAVMLAISDAIALTLMELKGFSRADFGMRHHGGYLGKAARGNE